jgi:hypothetical protein
LSTLIPGLLASRDPRQHTVPWLDARSALRRRSPRQT